MNSAGQRPRLFVKFIQSVLKLVFKLSFLLSRESHGRRMLRESNYNSMIEEAIIPKEEAAWNHEEVCLHF